MKRFVRDFAVVVLALLFVFALIRGPRWAVGLKRAWDEQTVQSRQDEVKRIEGCDTNPDQEVCHPQKAEK